MSGVRSAYLVSRYPAVTHTFIQTEVQALRRQGVAIQTFTVRRAQPGELLSPSDRQEDRATIALLPVRPLRLAVTHLRALVRSPAAYASTLAHAQRMGTGGPRATLWQLFYFAEAILLHAHLRARDIRHVHVHFANVASDVALLACRYGNRAEGGSGAWSWSLTVHGPTELLDLATHKLAEKARDAALVICTSDFARSQVLACLDGSDGARVRTVRCGIDVTRFAPGGDDQTEHEPLRVLNVAGMSRRKGQAELVEAIALVHGRGQPVHLTIVGEGPERRALEQSVAARGLSQVVTFAGALGHHEMPEAYRSADLFCLGSFAEGVPTVLMEAMASGLPVITTNVMGIPELVEHGVTGLLVPPARADALADAIQLLREDSDLRERLGAAARERVISAYEVETATRRVRAELERIVAR